MFPVKKRVPWSQRDPEAAREYMREYKRREKLRRTGVPVNVRGPYNLDKRRGLAEESGFDAD